VPAVEREIALLAGLEIGGKAVTVAQLESRLEQRRAEP
jgi:hypothetical protein